MWPAPSAPPGGSRLRASSVPGRRLAVRAAAAQDDVVRGDVELDAAAHRFDCPLQRAVREWRQPPALLADQVMVVLGLIEPLIGGSLAAGLDPLDEVQLLELLEGAVDAGPA